MKGKVMRADDRRRGPRSPEHRAAIVKGQALSRWSHEQSGLAMHGMPHEPVPISVRGAKALSQRYESERKRPARIGECHWCYFWGTNGEHI